MTQTRLTDEQRAATRRVVREIGDAIWRARTVAKLSKQALADRIAMHTSSIANLERGAYDNLKLGNAVRVLDHFGLTLAVVPLDATGRDERVARLVDRILALPGGEDLLGAHLTKRRGYELARRSES